MALRELGKCFKLDVPKEAMPYTICTYENVNMGACSIHDASDVLEKEGKQRFLDNLDKWNGNMDNQVFDPIKCSSIC